MGRDPTVYLVHMLETARRSVSSVAGCSSEAFAHDPTLRLAAERMIQIIGEAARRVPDDVRARHTDIPWRAIVAMRHKLVHDYFEADPDAVWSTIVHDLPPLIAQLERIVPPEAMEGQ